MNKEKDLQKACEEIIGVEGVNGLFSFTTPVKEISNLVGKLLDKGCLFDGKQNKQALLTYCHDLLEQTLSESFGQDDDERRKRIRIILERYMKDHMDWVIARILDATWKSNFLMANREDAKSYYERYIAVIRLLKMKQRRMVRNVNHMHHFNATLSTGDSIKTDIMSEFWEPNSAKPSTQSKKTQAETLYHYVYENVENHIQGTYLLSDEHKDFLKHSAALGLAEVALTTQNFTNAIKYAEEVEYNTHDISLRNRSRALLCLIYETMKDDALSSKYYTMVLESGDEDTIHSLDEDLTYMNAHYRLRVLLDEYRRIISTDQENAPSSLLSQIVQVADQIGNTKIRDTFDSLMKPRARKKVSE